jgi:hypothetical protein
MLRAALILILACLALRSAAAQHPQVRQGFWISGGLGYGSLDVSCDGCESERESGLTALLAMGGSTRPGLLLGAQLEGWTKEVDGVDLTFGHLSAVAYWYPRPAIGFFLKGGAGVGNLTADAGPLGDQSESGLALHAALGYDIRVGRNLSLTPAAGIFWTDLDEESANALQVGLSVTGH